MTARHHTAIVSEVAEGGTVLKIYHQGANGRKKVSATSLRLNDLQSGRFGIFHPIARTPGQPQQKPPMSDRRVTPAIPNPPERRHQRRQLARIRLDSLLKNVPETALSQILRVSETRRTCGRLDRCSKPDRAQRGDAPFPRLGRLTAARRNDRVYRRVAGVLSKLIYRGDRGSSKARTRSAVLLGFRTCFTEAKTVTLLRSSSLPHDSPGHE
jgi:hypothetical protein